MTSVFHKMTDNQVPILAFTDNESFYRTVHSADMTNEHRLRIDNAVIKHVISQNELQSIKWVPGTKQLANCLTKQGANSLNLTRVLENGQLLFST